MLQKTKKPTSKDLAKYVGVSQATVSRAFSDKKNSVSVLVREKIYKAANEIGYSPNLVARSMIKGKSNIIALVIGEGIGIFYEPIIIKLIEEIQSTGKQCLVFMINSRETVGDIVSKVMQFQVEAIIITGSAISKEIEQAIENIEIPVVLFNRYVNGISAVYTNPIRGGEMAAEHLFYNGHRKIGYISYSKQTVEENEKKIGFTSFLRQKNIHHFVEETAEYTYQSGYDAMKKLYTEHSDITAVFCTSDICAIGASDCCKNEFGLVVGETFSIIGYDGTDISGWKSYNLDTVKQPVDKLVRETIELVLSLLEHFELKISMVEVDLVVRGSVKKINVIQDKNENFEN